MMAYLGDQSPKSLYPSGTLKLRMPRLAQPGQIGGNPFSSRGPKPVKIGVIKTPASRIQNGVSLLSMLKRPRMRF